MQKTDIYSSFVVSETAVAQSMAVLFIALRSYLSAYFSQHILEYNLRLIKSVLN